MVALPINTISKTKDVEIRFLKMEFLKDIEVRLKESIEKLEEPKKEYTAIEWYDIEVSFYCACYQCCGKEDGITASGDIATEGITVALPPSIPLGTRIVIDGREYINQDRGGYIIELGENAIRADIYLDSHEECYERGRYMTRGYIIL